MALSRIRSNTPGQIDISDESGGTATKVDSDGRTTIQFYRNPKELAARFSHFLDVTSHPPERKKYTPRRGSVTIHELKETSTTPRLNIAIHIVGSRGDVQPFIPIAQLLSRPPYNHRVRICTHPVFKSFVESNGIEFFSIGGDPSALMAYMVKNPGLLPSRESFKAGEITKRREEMAEIIEGAWRSCIEAGNGLGERVTASDVESTEDLFIADAIIANPPSMAHIHCAEKLGIPLHMVFTMPWSPTREFHHPLASMKYGDAEPSVANYLSFMMMELLTWQGLGDLINTFRSNTLKLDPISPLWGHQLLTRLRVPYTYLWSESLIPKPKDWGPNIDIAGFSFLPLAKTYTPPKELSDFLAAGPAPVYIGFGSIVVDDPQKLTDMVFEAVSLAGVRAIVSKGWGGIGEGETPENCYMIGDCPHDWLFQQVSCVVHHGGAGTTAAGIAAGRPTVVVPFFGDQPFWGQMVAQAGAGPVPVPFKQMTVQSLSESLKFALKPEVQAAAKELAQRIAQEDGAGNAAQTIHTHFDDTELRCDLCPERLAVWRHVETGAHLSTFAAGILMYRGILNYQSIRLFRRTDWYTDEGAEGPTLGALAAGSGFFTSIALSTMAYRHRLKTPPTPRRRSSVFSTRMEATLNELPAPQIQLNGTDVVLEGKYNIKHLEEFALKMATRTFTASEAICPDGGRIVRVRTKRRHGERSRAYEVTRATGRYALDVAKAGLKAPVAFFYNEANGFRNLPSYMFEDDETRRRKEITGLGSGLEVAGIEFGLGFYEALSGLVMRPYKGSKKEGPKGFAKGVGQGFYGFFLHLGAAVFALPGYTLKGIEKEFYKRQISELKAELLLIRIRQTLSDLQKSEESQRQEIVERWNALHNQTTTSNN